MPAEIVSDRLRARTLRRYLGGVASQQNPQAVIVAGQPAAGKSIVVEELCHYYAQHGQCAVIDVNELRWLCGPDEPSFDAKQLSPRDAQLHQLAAELCTAAIDRRLHLVIAASLDDFDLEAVRLRELTAGGYQTAVIALKVAEETTWCDLNARADRFRHEGIFHRPMTREEHRHSISKFVQTLTCIENDQLVDEIYIIDRQGTSLAIATPRSTASSNVVSQSFADPPGSPSSHQKPTPQAAPEVIELSGGRKLKLGSFGTGEKRPSSPAPIAAAEEPQSVEAQPPSKPARGVKLGAFQQRSAVPDSPPLPPLTVQPQLHNITPPAAVNEPSTRNPILAPTAKPATMPQPPPPTSPLAPPPIASYQPLPTPIDHSRLSPAENGELARKRALQQKIRKRAGLD